MDELKEVPQDIDPVPVSHGQEDSGETPSRSTLIESRRTKGIFNRVFGASLLSRRKISGRR